MESDDQVNEHAVRAPLFAVPGPTAELAEVWLGSLGYNRAAPADVLIALLDLGHTGLLHRTDLPPGVLDAAVDHPDRRVWGPAAEHGRLSPGQWDRLLAATAGRPGHVLVRELAADAARHRGDGNGPAAGAEPPATPAGIAELADAVPDIGPDDRTSTLPWVAALHHDPDAMRQLAASPKTWIRRSVARARRLPRDVVEPLARDEDFAVRLFLTESCDDAPAELLLGIWEEGWTGSLSFPGRPRNHPGFPRDGLLRFLDDPRPHMRRLALDDPASTAADAERLARDPDPMVRREAAHDPRLSPATVAALAADDVSYLNSFAHRHPALPPALLAAALQDPFTAEDAALNPSLPVAVMHRMIAAAAASARTADTR
ncbi:hypothetical protein ABTX81_22070 [Kitasatospora sp. NPDC097605]|uniref:hypothetical protein n=1 Tax=Kitasatospora sp. NPDC097605 TaxID=3157226 RepID=UPI00331CC1CA